MPSLIDLRRRIRAVKNIQQITKAMKMVAASKLRRAQDRMLHARPYAAQMHRVLGSVAGRVDPSLHPLLAIREPRPDSRSLVVIITADKGLCGSFNTNIIKAAGAFIAESPNPCALSLVGRKGRDFFGRRGFEVLFELTNFFQKLRYEDGQAIAQHAMEAFTTGRVDRVVLAYNEFKSVIQQRVIIDQLLPIRRADVPETEPEIGIDYLYEPSAQEIFDQLLPRYVEVQVFRALLESNAAFYAAQMTAMDTSTKNSADMISQLTLYMNKVRQAAITREIIEVVSGAEAL
ncbi:MAG: ATP synthase F1 subunit gamma [Betaproteobacteria bacterium]